MIRAVLDTNVVVAGLRSRRGASFELLRLLGARQWSLVLSNTLLTEYQEVLHREQMTLPYRHEEIESFLDGICLRAERQRLHTRWWPVLTDPDDEALVHLAVEGCVGYIVTFNLNHLRAAESFGVRVLPPGDFLIELRKS